VFRYLQGGAGLCSGTYRAGQVCVPVLTGHYFICKGIWVVVIINVWHFEVGSF